MIMRSTRSWGILKTGILSLVRDFDGFPMGQGFYKYPVKDHGADADPGPVIGEIDRELYKGNA